REATEEELRKTIADSIALLSEEEAEAPTVEETWVNGEGVQLKLVEEEGAWNIYHGLNLEESFGNYGYAQGYLKDEQFTQVKE
ncbi:hypothetical protein J4G37_61575, partial [Microvirga sp. 3-52]|nr:hypothetical protein [Microvirga sp. 3-52]